MKGITSNPRLDAYQRMAISPVGGAQSPKKTNAAEADSGSVPNQQIAKVSISSEARQLAASGSQGALDTTKVAALKDAVESNSIKFDSAKIAERMVAALG